MAGIAGIVSVCDRHPAEPTRRPPVGILPFIVFGTLLVTTAATGAAGPLLEKTDLFEANTGGYAHERIPGLVVTRAGTLPAYREARKRAGLYERGSAGGGTLNPRSLCLACLSAHLLVRTVVLLGRSD